MRFACIKRARDIHKILEAASVARGLIKSRSSFRKKLNELLTAKGGEFKLWRTLWRLTELAEEIGEAPCAIELSEEPQEASAQ